MSSVVGAASPYRLSLCVLLRLYVEPRPPIEGKPEAWNVPLDEESLGHFLRFIQVRLQLCHCSPQKLVASRALQEE